MMNRVNKRKNLMWGAKIITLLFGYILLAAPLNWFRLGEIVSNEPAINTITYVILVIVFFAMVGTFYMVLYSLVWEKLVKHKSRLNRVRYLNHYNRCITALKERDFDRALKIYNTCLITNRVDDEKDTSARIKLAFKLLNNTDISDEYLEINEPYQKYNRFVWANPNINRQKNTN